VPSEAERYERARQALSVVGLTVYGPAVLALAERTAEVCDELLRHRFEFPAGRGTEDEAAREPFMGVLRHALSPTPSPEAVRAVYECPGLWGVDEGGGDVMSVCASLLQTLILELAWVFAGHPECLDGRLVGELVAAERRAGVR
jgi:hypothetical protein